MATKRGAVQSLYPPRGGAVIVLIFNIVHEITIIFVLIIHKDSHKYTLVG